jgi:hypothetical protein
VRERQRTARVAGLLYLLMSVTSTFSLGSIPSWSVGATDASAVVRRILDAPLRYRLGAVSDLAAQVFSVVLVLALYDLLKEVHRTRALAMVAFVLVQVPMGFANLLLGLVPLVLQSGAGYLSVFSKEQLDALTLVALNARGYGVKSVMVFWGLWLLPFGMLVYRSGFLPRALGVLLVVGCFGHVVVGVTSLLMPSLERAVAPLTALALGEILICLWLLIKGARPESQDQHSPHSLS